MNIEKIQINAKPRQLTAKWTVTLQHGEVEPNPELEETLAQQLKEEIDWELLCELMTELGWRLVQTKQSMYSNEDAYDIKCWVSQYCKGEYKARGNTWLFERAEDANWFALKWS